jgi:hypothetical protein
MKTTPVAKTPAERQAERRARMAKAKISRLELYVPEHLHEQVKAYVARAIKAGAK